MGQEYFEIEYRDGVTVITSLAGVFDGFYKGEKNLELRSNLIDDFRSKACLITDAVVIDLSSLKYSTSQINSVLFGLFRELPKTVKKRALYGRKNLNEIWEMFNLDWLTGPHFNCLEEAIEAVKSG